VSEKKKTNGRETRWKKGDPSPNPAGRPKSILSQAALNKIALEFATTPDPFDPNGRMRITRLLEKAYEAAIGKRNRQPSMRAIGELFERFLGKPLRVTLDANINVTREQRLAAIDELLRRLESPDGDSDAERVH
jgi:hypothetical protein